MKALKYNHLNFGITKEPGKIKPKQTSRMDNWTFALFSGFWHDIKWTASAIFGSTFHYLMFTYILANWQKQQHKKSRSTGKHTVQSVRVTTKIQISKYTIVNICELLQKSMLCAKYLPVASYFFLQWIQSCTGWRISKHDTTMQWKAIIPTSCTTRFYSICNLKYSWWKYL